LILHDMFLLVKEGEREPGGSIGCALVLIARGPTVKAAPQGQKGGALERSSDVGVPSSQLSERKMSYQWPLPQPDPVLDEALDIALDYLQATSRAKAENDVKHLVARSVLAAWLEGMRHNVRLANVGIVAVQQARARTAVKLEIENLFSVFPRVS
jgi:hypothetical protein